MKFNISIDSDNEKRRGSLRLLLRILFVFFPFIDALNGFLVANSIIPEGGVFSPSQLARLSVSVYFVSLIYYEKIHKSIFLLILYPLLVEVFSSFYHYDFKGFLFGFVYGYKLTYLILLFTVFSFLIKDNCDAKLLCSYIYYNLIIIACFLVFSSLTGIGNSTYGHGFGTKSFFSSGNGLGLYLGVFTFFLIVLNRGKFINLNSVILVFISCSIALIGSKAALILSFINLASLSLFSQYRWYFVSFVSFIFIYFWSEIIGVFSLVFDVIILRFNNSDNFFMYLASGRFDYVMDAFRVFMSQEPAFTRLVFGMGAFTSFQNPEFVTSFDTLETDLFDLLFMYGLIYVALYLILFLVVLIGFRQNFMLMVVFILLYLHSVFAGHVLFNGMSAIPLVVLALFSFNYKRLLVVSNKVNHD